MRVKVAGDYVFFDLAYAKTAGKKNCKYHVS